MSVVRRKRDAALEAGEMSGAQNGDSFGLKRCVCGHHQKAHVGNGKCTMPAWNTPGDCMCQNFRSKVPPPVEAPGL